MRSPVERLRVGLLVGAGLLVVVIAGFLTYARYKVRNGLRDLPGRLGATITKEFNGYTYSQSEGGKTVFTIHASKAVQHTDGMYTLHDVHMMLYGHKGDRADRISGDEFEYDTKNEVIRAIGVVHLDLEGPVAADAQAGEVASHPAGRFARQADESAVAGGRVVHVTTSGLVYMKKLGVAATAQGIDFSFDGFIGHAVGAEYDSDTGHLVLQSAISVSGVAGHGIHAIREVAMTASHGELDRGNNVAEFADAHYSSAGENAQAKSAKIHLRTDGTVERIEGDGEVTLRGAGQGSIMSDRADVVLDAMSKPKTAVLAGNVHYADDEALRQALGDSDLANIEFDGQGQLHHVVLQGHVLGSELVRGNGFASDAPSRRDLTTDNLELWLVADGKQSKPQMRDAKATGSAHLTTTATILKPASAAICRNLQASSGRCSVTTTNKLSGDVIQAHFIAPHGDAELSNVHGNGHTVVEQITSVGTDQVIYGSTLDANFREVPKTGAGNPAKGEVELATAVLQGGVAITRTLPGKNKAGGPAPPDVQHATARAASYDVDAGTITLAGDVRMTETGSTLTADRVVMEKDSGNATADGSIKATYLQTRPRESCAKKTGSSEQVHILASRAEFDHDDGRATFYGRPAGGGLGGNSGLARLWQAGAAAQGGAQDEAQSGTQDTQGGSQIEAPVLVFDQEQGRLTARAEKAGVAGQVHAALAYTIRATGKDRGVPSRQSVARITSGQMVYSDIERQAVLTGGVRLLDLQGDLLAQQVTIFLAPALAAGGAASKTGVSARSDTERAVGVAPCSDGAGASGTAANGAGASGILGGDVERIVATQHVEMTQPGHLATGGQPATGERKATGERLVYTASDQTYVLTGTTGAPPKLVDALQGTSTGAEVRFHFGGPDDREVVVSGRDGTVQAQKVHTETRIKQK